MKSFKNLTVLAVVISLGVCSSAMALDLQKNTTGANVAVVDVAKIVENSPQINAIKIDRKNKLDDLEKFVLNARKDVAAQKTDNAKKDLEDKYNKELNVRKNAIDQEYAKKLIDIDKDITSLIKIKAKKLGYDLTLTKNAVIDGGTDITPEIIKELK